MISAPVRADEASLAGSVRQETVFFKGQERIRRQAYELYLKQETPLSPSLKTVIAGRASYDTALLDRPYATGRTYPKAVRDDELFEAEARELYIEQSGESYRVKLGLQQIDWIDSLSIQSSELLTPMDLRHGGYGAPSEIIRPVGAGLLTHDFILGTSLQWLVVPRPVDHRLPAGPNGYGYYEALERSGSGGALAIREAAMPESETEAEGGLRLLSSIAKWDLSLFGYSGHQRQPTFKLAPLNRNLSALEEYHPRVNTFGLFVSRSDGGAVVRAYSLYQPNSVPTVVNKSNPDPDTARSLVQRLRLGAGFDYTWSKHLSIYTDEYATRLHRLHRRGINRNDAPVSEDYVVAYRIANNTLTHVGFVLEGLVTAPEQSYLCSPTAQWDVADDVRLALGARLVGSSSDQSDLDVIRETSQYFLTLEYAFKASQSQ